MSRDVILITGGTGFAGSHLVEVLLASGETQIHVTCQSGRGGFVSQLLPADQIHELDLINFETTANLIKRLQPNQIYHLAATAAVGSSFNQTRKILENHLELQLSLLEAVRQFAPKSRILAIGSALEYDTTPTSPHLVIDETHPLGPVSPYAVSKAIQSLLATSYVKTHRLDVVLARPFNHIGERQGLGFVVSDFAAQIVKIERGLQTEIRVGNLLAERDFTDVKDMVGAYQLLMHRGITGEVYNLGSGRAHSVQNILNWLKASALAPVVVVPDPLKFRPLDINSIIADNDKVCALGWQPTEDIKPTVERILAWWRTQKI
ncbi:MAG TPA: GDP-mannose 4,6-dehydratase [Candidatus Pacebacteria bacterium]|nr:GDP-mannose 4,6-dehydratase [Candidatus Paceibacterota bacterium]